MSERPQRNLALELVRCTEAAALAAAQFMGTGNQEAGVQAAVDPVEGTRLLALGRPNAISVIALAERWSMWNPGPSLYMDKIVVDKRARDVIDLTQSPTDNLNHSLKNSSRSAQSITRGAPVRQSQQLI